MHKRYCFPKSGLLKLKDAIHEDNYPSLELLKQKSDDKGTTINTQSTIRSSYPFKKRKLISQVPQDEFEFKFEDEGQKGPSSIYHVTTNEYQKEMSYISTKKQDFFKYIFKGREDFSATKYWKKQNLCMKCAKTSDDQLLICGSDVCSFIFHENCLVSTMIMSESDKTMRSFYCPFCEYSNLVMEFNVMKKKASMARNDMVFFFSGCGMNRRSKAMSRESRQ